MSDPTQQMPPAQPPRTPPGQVYGPPPARKAGFWRQATSTTGGRVMTGIALALAGLMLLGLLGVGVFGVSRAVHLWGDRGDRVSEGWGPGGRFDDDDMGPGMGRGMGPGMRQGNGGLGGGLGGDGMMGGNGLLGRLGGVQHGELTITGSDGKPVVMTVQRGTVTAASATSLTVRSADGFSQTYAVNASTRVGGATGATGTLAKNQAVVVLGRKADSVAVQVRVVSR